MDSLVGYGSEDEIESERFGPQQSVGGTAARRREDDTNYESVNMDMSEDSQGVESEPELPQADNGSRPPQRSSRHSSNDSREHERERERDRDRERERERRRDDRRSPRRDEQNRSERTERRSHEGWPRRGLLGDRPEDRPADQPDNKYARDADIGARSHDGRDARDGRSHDAREARDGRSHDARDARDGRSHDARDARDGRSHDARDARDDRSRDVRDARPHDVRDARSHDIRDARPHDVRDAVSPRFVERAREERAERRDRERDRDRDSRPRRSEERRSGRERREERSRSRGAAFPPPQRCTDRRSPSDYRPSSYKVNKKLEVMEKMGLQIKTPDGSMATAQQLRAAAGDAPRNGSALGAPGARVLQQVQKRKLLWAKKDKTETEAAKWSGTKFAQDSDGKQVSKFMRLMGIKDPAAIGPEPVEPTADPNKKQEELFQAMQAQYDVARATTHTMRGVGLGFQRSQF